ncbi:MAG: hypothetical protein KDJ25_09560 [Rhodoblastus sp.]|nr:hypothetical protein [Rhodoblastus sp.]
MPVLIGLAIALAVAAVLALSGAFVTPPIKQSLLPVTAPSADTRAREEAEHREVLRHEAEKMAAERAAADKKTAEERAEAERTAAAERAELARKTEAAQKVETERRETERRRLEAARKAAADKEEHERIDAEKRAAQALAEARRTEAEARLKADAAEADWRASAGGGAAALQSYLQRHPDGAHAADARAALDGLLNSRPARGKDVAPARDFTPDARDDAAARGQAPRRNQPRAAATRHPAKAAAPAQSADRRPRKRGHASTARLKPVLGANGERVIRIVRANALKSPAARVAVASPAPKTDAAAAPKQDQTARPVAELFPAEPPRASARYDIPEAIFAAMRTYGEATKFLLAALENGGYAERSFFSTQGGVAMITRLERIADDGAPMPARWSLKQPPDGAVEQTLAFLRGKFAVEPGRYRTIVFQLHDHPAPAIVKTAAGGRSKGGTTCAVLVYEFVSDGSTVRLVENGLSAKEHLAKAGLLKAFEPAR